MSLLVQVEPLYKQAYDLVKKLILTGKIKPGERIVSTKLAEEFQISRTPLREALRQLAKEGLLIQDNVSTRVVELNAKDFEELIACRSVLEKELIRLIVHQISDETLDEAERNVLKGMELLKEEDNRLSLLELNTRFHELLIQSCPNRHLIELLNITRSKLLLYRASVNQDAKNNSGVLEEHLAIVKALKERNEQKAESMIEMHLKNDYIRGAKIFV